MTMFSTMYKVAAANKKLQSKQKGIPEFRKKTQFFGAVVPAQ